MTVFTVRLRGMMDCNTRYCEGLSDRLSVCLSVKRVLCDKTKLTTAKIVIPRSLCDIWASCLMLPSWQSRYKSSSDKCKLAPTGYTHRPLSQSTWAVTPPVGSYRIIIIIIIIEIVLEAHTWIHIKKKLRKHRIHQCCQFSDFVARSGEFLRFPSDKICP